jgi:hypothetical protein
MSGTDPVEARYLVHPAYCERLIEMEQEFDGGQIGGVVLAVT